MGIANCIKSVCLVVFSFLGQACLAQEVLPGGALFDQGVERPSDYVTPSSSPFADARFQALELRVQGLEEVLAASVEQLELERERRRRLERLLQDAGILRTIEVND